MLGGAALLRGCKHSRRSHAAFVIVFMVAVTTNDGAFGKVCKREDLFSRSVPEERIPAICDTLKLNKMKLGDDGIGAISAELTGNTAVTRLWVDDCDIRAKGVGWLSNLLKDPTCSLREVHIDTNNFGPAGVHRLAKAIEVNIGVRELSLRWNSIRTAEAKIIAKAVKVNKGLKILKLHGNLMEDGGAFAFAEALLANDVLEVLLLGSNGIGDAGAAILAESMKVNTAMTELALIPSPMIKNKQLLREISKECAENKGKTSDNFKAKLERRSAGNDDPLVKEIQLKINALFAKDCVNFPRHCPEIAAAASLAKKKEEEARKKAEAEEAGLKEGAKNVQSDSDDGSKGGSSKESYTEGAEVEGDAKTKSEEEDLKEGAENVQGDSDDGFKGGSTNDIEMGVKEGAEKLEGDSDDGSQSGSATPRQAPAQPLAETETGQEESNDGTKENNEVKDSPEHKSKKSGLVDYIMSWVSMFTSKSEL